LPWAFLLRPFRPTDTALNHTKRRYFHNWWQFEIHVFGGTAHILGVWIASRYAPDPTVLDSRDFLASRRFDIGAPGEYLAPARSRWSVDPISRVTAPPDNTPNDATRRSTHTFFGSSAWFTRFADVVNRFADINTEMFAPRRCATRSFAVDGV